MKKEGGKFMPTELGMVVTDLLLESFNDIFDVTYTARMEEELDEIEEGKIDWREAMARVLRALPEGSGARRAPHDRHQADGETHRPDLREVRQADGDQVGQARQLHRLHRLSGLHQHARADGGSAGCRRRPISPSRTTRSIARTAAVRWCSRRAASDSSSPAPDIRIARPPSRSAATQKKADVPLDEKCPQCGNNLVLKYGRFGEFTACSNYPTCKYVKQKTIGVKCPNCSRGRGGGAALQARQDILRLQPLSRLRFRGLGQADSGEMSGMRQQLPDREVAEGRRRWRNARTRVQIQTSPRS